MSVNFTKWAWAVFGLSLTFAAGTSRAQDYSAPAAESFEQRLARLEEANRQLQQQLSAQQYGPPPYAAPQSGLVAEPVGALLNADDKKDAPKPPANPELGGCKEVELITKPQMKLIGRLFLDVVNFEDKIPSPVFGTSAANDRQNEAGISFARIGWNGYIYENVFGQVEIAFENGIQFKDTFIEAQNLPMLGRVKAGFFKEPVNLEDMTSDNVTTFMSRSLAIRAFSPSRRFGVMAYDYFNENPDTGWFLGTFRRDFGAVNTLGGASGSGATVTTTQGTEAQDAGDWTFDGRLVWLPIYDEPSDGRYLVHLGSSLTYRKTGGAGVSFSGRSELGQLNSVSWLQTGTIADKDYVQYGAEMLVIWGPSSVQAEYFVAPVDGGQVGGGYVQLSYFLTGENRGYRRDEKIIAGVKPIEDFFRVCTADGICQGRGAWELALRYSFLDLAVGPGVSLGGGVNSRGYENSTTVGLNWYWNPNTRMMFDYVWEDVHRLGGASDGLGSAGMRWQINF